MTILNHRSKYIANSISILYKSTMNNENPDFTAIVNELLDGGLTATEIAAEARCTEAYIRHLSKAAIPVSVGWPIGSRLLRLREDYVDR